MQPMGWADWLLAGLGAENQGASARCLPGCSGGGFQAHGITTRSRPHHARTLLDPHCTCCIIAGGGPRGAAGAGVERYPSRAAPHLLAPAAGIPASQPRAANAGGRLACWVHLLCGCGSCSLRRWALVGDRTCSGLAAACSGSWCELQHTAVCGHCCPWPTKAAGWVLQGVHKQDPHHASNALLRL